MRQPFRRVQALLLSGAILWGVGVTAGSQSAAAAGQALRQALPVQLLRWSLGEPGPRDGLSSAAVAALSASPLLLSARRDLALLRTQETEQPSTDRPEPTEPVPEAPQPPPEGADNGIPARTLVPRDPAAYTVVGRTYISSSRDTPLDPALLDTPFSTRLGEEGPQLLILHTHGSEAYTPADDTGIVWSGNHRSTDMRCGVVRVGDAMADEFSKAGVSVLHDRTLYDYPNYTGSYDRSLEGIQRHLEAHPSIRFVLDVHRDAIEDKAGNQYKVLSDIAGVGSAAQLTLVVGSDGSGLPHPNWLENLRLAVALQEDLLTEYPTLMRPILLRKSRYNQHAAPGSLLVEVGAAGNSPEEAELAGRLFAKRMAAVLLESGAEVDSAP